MEQENHIIGALSGPRLKTVTYEHTRAKKLEEKKWIEELSDKQGAAMPISADDFKWWHYLVGAALATFSAIFGAGMASQKFINGFQTRLLTTERHREADRKDIEKILTRMEKHMTTEDFRREQHICQAHMVTLIGDIKTSNDYIKESLDELMRLIISHKER